MALTLNGTSGITGAGIGTIGPSGANITGVVTCTSAGIGTNGPVMKMQLHEASSGNNYIKFTNDTTGSAETDGVHLGLGSDEAFNINQRESNDIRLFTGATERLRITGDGPHLLLGGTSDVNEITETSSNTGMVIGNTSLGNGGIAIINSTSGTGRIYFGDATGSNAARNRGQINYYHNGDYMMFATAGSERLRIDSSGMSKFTRGSGGTVAHFYANDRESNILIQNDARTWKIVNYDYGNNGTDNLGFHDGTADRMIIQNDGDVKIGDGDLIIGTSGHGIDFSADGNASGSSSEILDDYEEGSWTPADGGGVVPFTESVGRYRKIGNLVVCAMFIRCTNNVTDGGNAYIVGLPFTSANEDAAGHGGFAIGASNVTQLHSAHTNKNSSLFYFYDNNYATIGRSTMWDGDSTQKRLIAVLTYFTT